MEIVGGDESLPDETSLSQNNIRYDLIPPFPVSFMLLTCLLSKLKTCVRRRAILSVAANPNCISREEAERAVNEVWESCSSDTRPFDEVCAVISLAYNFS